MEASPAASPEYSQIFDFPPEKIERPEAPSQQQSGVVDTLSDAAQEELAVVQEGSEATDISGEDVVNRMSQFFEAPVEEMEKDKIPLLREPASFGEEDIDKTVRFDTARFAGGGRFINYRRRHRNCRGRSNFR